MPGLFDDVLRVGDIDPRQRERISRERDRREKAAVVQTLIAAARRAFPDDQERQREFIVNELIRRKVDAQEDMQRLQELGRHRRDKSRLLQI